MRDPTAPRPLEAEDFGDVADRQVLDQLRRHDRLGGHLVARYDRVLSGRTVTPVTSIARCSSWRFTVIVDPRTRARCASRSARSDEWARTVRTPAGTVVDEVVACSLLVEAKRRADDQDLRAGDRAPDWSGRCLAILPVVPWRGRRLAPAAARQERRATLTRRTRFERLE